MCLCKVIFSVSLLKQEKINDLKTAEIKSIRVRSCGVLEYTLSSERFLKNTTRCFKLQVRKFTKTKLPFTRLPSRHLSPRLFICLLAKQLTKCPPDTPTKVLVFRLLDSENWFTQVWMNIQMWRQFFRAIIKYIFCQHKNDIKKGDRLWVNFAKASCFATSF